MSHQGPSPHIDVYLDPGCPWSWVTSRWLVEARGARGLHVTWCSYSLLLRDGERTPPGMPPEIAAIVLAASRQSLRLLRVFEAVRQHGDAEVIDDLYAAWGRRVFAPGPPAAPDPGLVADLAHQCGLDDRALAAADDAAWDQPIAASMQTATTLLGQTPITPTLVLTGQQPAAFAGPVLSKAPNGDAATRLWDALYAIATEPAFSSLQRPAPPLPTLPGTEA